jgi:choline monooxygenase
MARGERAPLTSKAYYDTEWFYREQETIFRSNWLYVGSISEFESDRSWLTVDYGNRSWIVIRSGDEFLCYRNVCSHRHARILSAPKGCSPIRCAYHGWTYAVDGTPTGLPGQRDNFDLSPDERASLRLPKGQAIAVGNFVFLKDNEKNNKQYESIDDAVVKLLKNLSETFDRPFYAGSHLWDANWKVGVENTLEPYHAGFVHSETLAQVIDLPYDKVLRDTHSSHGHRLKPASHEWWVKMSKLAGIKPSPHFHDYLHFFIYPNLCIGITYGSLLSIQVFRPVGPEGLELFFYLFLPNSNPSEAKAGFRSTLEEYLVDYNRKIIEEDRAPVEACQRGYRDAVGNAILGESEERIGVFQRKILNDIPVIK